MDLESIEQSIDILYPAFRKYVKEYLGHLACPSIWDIKLWFRFMDFVEEVNNDNRVNSSTNK